MSGERWRNGAVQKATLSRMLRSPVMLRIVIYGSAVLLSIYGLFYFTQTKEPFTSIIPDYLNPTPGTIPGVSPGAGGKGGSGSVSGGAGEEDKTKILMPTAWKDRADVVKKAFQHAYHGYARYAAPSDELRPLSNGRINK
jgi:hypothetical protein